MKKFLPLIILVALIAALVWWLSGGDVAPGAVEQQVAAEGDPIDVVNAFYGDWLDAVQSTSSNPFTAGLTSDARLSAVLQQQLQDRQSDEQDPVLCQNAVPERTGARVISQTDFTAEAQVLARGLPERSSIYALVTLAAVNGEWQIANIVCEDAAAEPEVGEFTFDKSGFLLKSVPEPLNSDYWHLVFTENNVPGHTAPLYFDETSVCIAADGEEAACDESKLQEPDRVRVQGSMTEAGVSVGRLTFE
jgi:hypothetical protein